MNTKLLRQIEKVILEEPKRLDMGGWISFSNHHGPRQPPCGTVACIAGWAIVIDAESKKKNLNRESAVSGVLSTGRKYSVQAAEILSINSEQRNRLFFAGDWPKRFQEKLYDASCGSAQAASVTVARIEHFIKTKGKE